MRKTTLSQSHTHLELLFSVAMDNKMTNPSLQKYPSDPHAFEQSVSRPT